MPIRRIDLADAGSPEKLVTLILKGEPDMPTVVPIEQLCKQLDIEAIETLESEGFEGGLITDPERSSGIILVKEGWRQRQRFTIAHELGHFLMPRHVPDVPGRFLCSRADMQMLKADEANRRGRMEVEANRFASLLLMPPPALRIAMKAYRDPDLRHVPQLARLFEVSKEAAARAYTEYNEQPIASLVIRNGFLLRAYRQISFPRIAVNYGRSVPNGSHYHLSKRDVGCTSELGECLPDLWIDVERGRAAPTLYEQIYQQRDGFALIMLWLERPIDDDDEQDWDADRTSKERYRQRQARWQST